MPCDAIPSCSASTGASWRRRDSAKARVAAARKLGIRLWIMLRDQIEYEEFCRRSPRRQS